MRKSQVNLQKETEEHRYNIKMLNLLNLQNKLVTNYQFCPSFLGQSGEGVRMQGESALSDVSLP